MSENKNSNKNTRNYTAKRMIIQRTGRTHVIPDKKKDPEPELITSEYLYEIEEDLEDDDDGYSLEICES